MNLRLILYCLALLIFQSCENKLDSSSADLKLIWYPTTDTEKIEEGIIGLQWTYSYLGASLPINQEGIKTEGNILLVDLDQLGFSNEAISILTKLHQKIKISEEYQKTGKIDLARYVSLLIGSSSHYYAIVGQEKHLKELLKKYKLEDEKMLITHSGVSKVYREILFSANENGKSQLFLAKEIDPKTADIEEFETIELMSNGQLKFGIFDADSTLMDGAKKHITNAGKPAKCMWCHESTIQSIFKKQLTKLGFMIPTDVKKYLDNFKTKHCSLQEKLASKSHLKFQNRLDHTKAELLYISFMEPSAKRLSAEWGITEQKVRKMLQKEKTHFHFEFHFLGELYDRSAVEKFAPFKSISVSPSIREFTKEDVNYLK